MSSMEAQVFESRDRCQAARRPVAGAVRPARIMGRAFRRHGDRGTAAREMALVGPAFLLMVLMLFEFGFQAAIAAALDHGAVRAGRMGITGAITANGPVEEKREAREAALRTAVLAAGGGLLNDDRLVMTYGTVRGPGGAGELVHYNLTYTQPLLTGSLAAAVLQRTELTHTSKVTVVNEVFPTKK